MPDRPIEQRRGTPDRALWREAVRGVAPLRRRAPDSPPAASSLRENGAGAAEKVPARQPGTVSPDRSTGIDRATAERLRRGLRPIEARLDMHGMTQAEAHRALTQFVRASREAGRRCVLVITGRGLGTDGLGILKNAVPRWLAETGLRQHILTAASARPRHGGAGALYLLLRRRR
jgi:DNA-nicking Smr family endonuclease